jgi:uncharacterized protein YbjT (DUF2867 family)
MSSKVIVIVGATGLVGSAVIDLLKYQPSYEVRCLVRSPYSLNDSDQCPNITYHVVSFLDLDDCKHLFDGVTHVICAVGTTIKKAKTREQFQLVDHYIPKAVARIAKESGAQSFQLISSIGANPKSSSFYLQVKGMVEDIVIREQYERLIIYRPSLLAGKRTEFRFFEQLMLMVCQMFLWVIPIRYRPTKVSNFASRIVEDIAMEKNGVHIVESSVIH